MKIKGHIENQTGYTLTPTENPAVFIFKRDDRHPLTWCENGRRLTTCHSFPTDGRSGGLLVSLVLNAEAFKWRGPFFHDCGYQNGVLQKIVVEHDANGNGYPTIWPKKFRKVALDRMLCRIIRSEGASRWQCFKVFLGLQLPPAWIKWREYRKRK
jgi:hypothetical protein